MSQAKLIPIEVLFRNLTFWTNVTATDHEQRLVVTEVGKDNHVPERSGGSPVLDETNPTAQILLPLVCAIFIVLVICVISFCLIKKRASGIRSRKSIHVTDTSDCGIYDVIDEVLAISYNQQDKISRRSDLLTSHLVPSNRRDCLRTKPSDARNPPPRMTDDGYDIARVPDDDFIAQAIKNALQENQNVPTRKEEDSEEERIYETLDKNWKLKYENECRSLPSSTSRKQTKSDNAEGLLSHSNSQDDSQTAFTMPDSGDNQELFNFDESDNESLKTNRLICQLSVFELCPETKEMKPVNTNLYYTIPEIHSSNQLVPNIKLCLQVNNPDSDNTPSMPRMIPLQPAQDTGFTRRMHVSPEMCQPHGRQYRGQPDNNSCKENDGPLSPESESHNNEDVQTAASYDKLHRVPSPKPVLPAPRILVRKSESFKESLSPSCRLMTAVTQRRRSDSFGSSSKQARFHNPQQTRETARILSKLGPLPPIPSTPSVSQRTSRNDVRTASDHTSDNIASKTPNLPFESNLLLVPSLRESFSNFSGAKYLDLRTSVEETSRSIKYEQRQRDLSHCLDAAESGMYRQTSNMDSPHNSFPVPIPVPVPVPITAAVCTDETSPHCCSRTDGIEQRENNHYFILEHVDNISECGSRNENNVDDEMFE